MSKEAAAASYKLTLKADSGYKSEQTGRITPEQYGAACHVLGGNVSPELVTGAQDVLAAAEFFKGLIDNLTSAERTRVGLYSVQGWDKHSEAIAAATGMSRTTSPGQITQAEFDALPTAGPTIAEMQAAEILPTVNLLEQRDELLAALGGLILFTKPSKFNALALHNAHQVIAKVEGGAK